VRASLELHEDKGVFWQAIDELAWEFLKADKGEAHGARYLKALQVSTEWAFKKGLAPTPSQGDRGRPSNARKTGTRGRGGRH
jgi:hypothetical protein